MHVTIKNVHFFTLILNLKFVIVHGMIEDFVGMVLVVGIDTFDGSFV